VERTAFGADALALVNGEPPREPELAALRDFLRGATEAIAQGGRLGGAELATLNGYLARTAVRAQLERDGARYVIRMTPVEPDPVRELAGSFASMLRFAPGRLKLCDACGRAFMDESRNRRRRWCDPNGCGNRERVRRHRARRRAADA
jgi:predicted RNA-binding Zn ribbon-like protein